MPLEHDRLVRAAEPELFTREELDAVGEISRAVDAYLEKCGVSLDGAKVAGIDFVIRERALPLLSRRCQRLLEKGSHY